MALLQCVHQCYYYDMFISVDAMQCSVFISVATTQYVHQCFYYSVYINVGATTLVVLLQHRFCFSNINIINGVATKQY